MATLNKQAGDAAGAVGAAIAPFSGMTDAALANIRRVYEALTPNRDTLGILFSLDAAQTEPSDQWITYFVETASAQLIWDERPTGSLREEDARWVVARFDEAPTVATLAVLVRVVEEAQTIPSWFSAAVRQRAELFGSKIVQVAPPARRPPYLRLVA